MLRRSVFLHSIATFSDPCLPRVLNRVTPGRLEATLTLLKERRKRTRYQSSMFQHYGDRVQLYVSRGGPKKGTKYIVEPHHNRAQYTHRGSFKGRYDIRAVKTAGAQYDMMGNTTRTTWDASLCTTNAVDNGSLRKNYRCLPKEEAIARVEEWGVRYIMLDEIRKPSLENAKYHRHSLFANKFYWSPFPETNHRIGEADFKWRGDEQISYADYGAATAHPRNLFRSLWHTTRPPPSTTTAA